MTEFERNTVVNPNAVPTLPKMSGITRCVVIHGLAQAGGLRDAAARSQHVDQRHRHRLGTTDPEPEQERDCRQRVGIDEERQQHECKSRNENGISQNLASVSFFTRNGTMPRITKVAIATVPSMVPMADAESPIEWP